MPGGRPTKLDREAANAIVSILQKGLPIEDACEAAGIDDATFQRWCRRGEKAMKAREPAESELPFREFSAAVKKARALGKVAHVQTIERAALGTETHPGDWKAAAWLLERMYPKQFGRKYIRIEAGGVDGPEPSREAPAPIIELTIENVETTPEAPQP